MAVRTAGVVRLEVVPDLTGFQKSLKSQLSGKPVTTKVTAEADTAQAVSDVRKAADGADATAVVEAKADTAGIKGAVSKAADAAKATTSVEGKFVDTGIRGAVDRVVTSMKPSVTVRGAYQDGGMKAGISAALSGVKTSASNAGTALTGALSSAAHRTGGAIQSAMGAGVGAIGRIPPIAGAAVGALTAMIGPAAMLKGGFDRLMGIQRSEIIFKNIGLTADETSAQMDKLSEQVTGTSVSLADAAQKSAAFAQSGVELGKPMDDAIDAFASLSAAAGDSGVDVGFVMQQISAQGKVTGNDMMQMSGAGINATAWLAKSMGISMEEVSDKVSAGEVSFDDFVKAVNSGAGDLAHEMGQTLPAKIGNMKTAFSNMGAAIIEPVIAPMTRAVELLTSGVKAAVGPLKAFMGWLSGPSTGAQILKGVIEALGVAFAAAFGPAAVGMIVVGAKAIGTALWSATGPIGLVVAAIAGVVTGIVILWNKCQWFRDAVTGIWDSITGLFGGIDFSGMWSGLMDSLQPVKDFFGQVGDLAKGVIDIIFHGDYTGMPFGLEEDSPVVGVLFGIRDAAQRVWDIIKMVGSAIADVGKSLMSAGWETIKTVFESIVSVGKALFDAFVKIGKAVWDLVQVLMPILWPILKVIGAVIGGVLVVAIFALIGALKVVSVIIQVVATVIGWLVDNILAPMIEVIGTVAGFLIDVLAAAFQLVADVVGNVCSFIGDVFSTVWTFLQEAWANVGQPVLDLIVGAFQFFWDGLMLGFRLIGATFEVIWTGLGMAWDAWGQPVLDLIVGAFQWLWDGIQNVVGWIRDRWNDMVRGFQIMWDAYGQPIVDKIGQAFQWMSDRISDVVGWIGDKISALGDWISGLYNRYVQPMVDNVTRGFNKVKEVVSGFKDKVVGVLKDAGSWLIDTGKNIVQGLLKGIGSLAGKIGDFFLDKIPGWIKGPFKKALGIASPSKVFAGYGEFIGEGLIAGVDSMGSQVQAATQAMADQAGDITPPVITPQIADAARTALVIPQTTTGPTGPDATAPGTGGAAGAGAGVGPQADGDPAAALSDAAAAMQATTTGVLDPLWAAQNLQVTGFGTNMATTMATQVTPTFSTMATSLAGTKAMVMDPMFAGINGNLAGTSAAFNNSVNGQITPAWQRMGADVMAVKTGTVDPMFAGIQGGLNNTVAAFSNAATGIANQWSRVREATAAPVRFAINSVFNDGLVGMWNSVAEMLGVDRMPTYQARFATGGYVRGPGGPTDDKVPALLSDREFVINAKATRALGPENLAALNSGNYSVAPGVLRDPAQRRAMLQDKTFRGVASRYQGGGLAQGTPAWKALLRGYNWARSRDGRPYVWGGSADGAGGADCSGFMSGIADVILGGSGARQWATMSFPGTQGGAWAPGLTSGFSVGISAEHTAGTIGGVEGIPAVNVESGGSNGGMAFGRSTTVGANDGQFPNKQHLVYTGDGKFVGGSGSGADMGQIVGALVKPFQDKMNAAISGWSASHPGLINTWPAAIADKLGGAAKAKIDKLVEEMMAHESGNPDSYRGMIKAAYRRQGYQWTQAKEDAWVRQIASESSGIPGRVQEIVDQNGTGESAGVGLGQMIPTTWAAYRDPELPDDRKDPWAMINAMVRYGEQKFGDGLLDMIGHGHGYDRGGIAPGIGAMLKWTNKPERVLSPRQTTSFDRLVSVLDRGAAPGDAGGRTEYVGQRVENQYLTNPDDVLRATRRGVRKAARQEGLRV